MTIIRTFLSLLLSVTETQMFDAMFSNRPNNEEHFIIFWRVHQFVILLEFMDATSNNQSIENIDFFFVFIKNDVRNLDNKL